MFTIDYSSHTVSELYGCNCFTEQEMESYLSDANIRALKQVQRGKSSLTLSLADKVAGAMKAWAIKKGATHYCHWFQPLTGLTAEKHDSFIVPTKGGKVLLEFSGKELIKGEGDASSLPNGGLRSTFEARGYTAWDTSSPAFIKEVGGEKILYIPTAFFSYNGEALDKKAPLLRSTQALEKQTLRVLKALGKKAKRITVNIGPEQEYFLVNREYYDRRPDLRIAGRTVLGSLATKGQELNDHYYGTIGEKVSNFMAELNYNLWKLGISAKTQHMEAAPNQFEIAVVYDAANIAVDHNQLVMEEIQTTALKHNMVALLHEKPYAGVNGSGKHDNWSLATDDHTNLLSPGSKAEENLLFLLLLTSFIKAVDLYAPVIRCSAASAGNDFRLGSAEAPPAIISIFLGEALTRILDSVSEDKPYTQSSRTTLGMNQLPLFFTDMTDRNRTSPMAFTGNKFEFRMPGSSRSVAGANIVINTAMASVLEEVADRLGKCENVETECRAIIKEFYSNHKRVIFNGNGYDKKWIEEAERRGLRSINNTVDAIPCMLEPESIALFESQKVFTAGELASRADIYLDIYSKQLNIEASILDEMVNKHVIPAVTGYLKECTASLINQKALQINCAGQTERVERLASLLEKTIAEEKRLSLVINRALNIEDVTARARFYRDEVKSEMEKVRTTVDAMERISDSAIWPFPTYDDLLFRL